MDEEEKVPDFVLRMTTILAILKKAKKRNLDLSVEELHGAVFLLQSLFGVDLDYRFKKIQYTPQVAGVFSAELQQELGRQIRSKEVRIIRTEKEKLRRYRITEKGNDLLTNDFFSDFLRVKNAVDELFDFTGKNPERFGLYSLVLFFLSQGIAKVEDLEKEVKKARPLLKDDTIKKAIMKILLVKITGTIPISERDEKRDTRRSAKVPARALKIKPDKDILFSEVILSLLEKISKFRSRKYATEEELQSAVLILQKVFKTGFECRFGKVKYTHYSVGPYSVSVHKELERLVSCGYVTAKRAKEDDSLCYAITREGNERLSSVFPETALARKKVNSLFRFTGKKPENLKLYGTALFLFLLGVKEPSELIKQVKACQPQFNDALIEKAVKKLVQKLSKLHPSGK